MFSDAIKAALENEVVGQPRAVNSVVRGVTRLISGLTPREHSLCAYLFMGPSGTGKTHVVRTLARILHGDESRVFTAECGHLTRGDPWTSLGVQLFQVFTQPRLAGDWSMLGAPPMTMIRLDYIERAPKEVCLALAAALETGHITLPGGFRGSLRNCILFLTSGLCAAEILDETTSIGFKATLEGEDEETSQRIYKVCRERAEEKFGSDLIGRLDGLVLFRRLEGQDLAEILSRRVGRLNDWLARRGFQCVVLPAAVSFLLERGRRDLRLGARDLVRASQRYVEFPLADLLVSGQIPGGSRVLIDRRPEQDHLHFTVTQPQSPQATREEPLRRVEVG